MGIEEATYLSVLVSRMNRYKEILKNMESGYSDEWQFVNSKTGVSVEFSCDDWAEIRTMVERELDGVVEKIELIKVVL